MDTTNPKSPMLGQPLPRRDVAELIEMGAIYTDDIVTSSPENPTIPTDPEELGLRIVLLELEIDRLRVILDGLTALHLPGRSHGR